MSKQSNKDEEVVPVPTSFEVNNDELWAAEHTEFESKFINYATSTSDESDGDILNAMFPNFVSEEEGDNDDDVDEQPVINDGLVLDGYAEDDVDEEHVAADEVVLPPHINEFGLPPNVDKELPSVNSDGLVLPEVNSDGVMSVPEDEDEMMSVVSDLGGEIISVMAEETVNKTGSALAIAKLSLAHTFEGINCKFNDVNDDATALIFPEPPSFVEDKSSTSRSSRDLMYADSVTAADSTTADSVTASDSVTADDSISATSFGEAISVGTSGTYGSTWAAMVMGKIMRRKYKQEESVMTPITDVQESREPEESLETDDEREGDDDGVWSFMNVCGGLKQSIGSTTDRFTDYIFPYNGQDLIAQMQAEEEAKLAAAAASAAETDALSKSCKEKKRFKNRIKSGKVKNLFRRRRSAKKESSELLAE